MSLNIIKLTIAIPTYNRVGILKVGLPKLFAITSQLDNVNVLISDNGSTDDTKEYIDQLLFDYNFDYFRLNENKGFDSNYLNCIDKAIGEYIWILSDDDLIVDGGVEEVLNHLNMFSPDYLLLNGGGKLPNGAISSRLANSENKVYKSLDCFFSDVGWHATWISACIFLASKARNYKCTEFIGSGFVQVDILLSEFNCGDDVFYVINKPIIYGSGNESSWWSDQSKVLSYFSDALSRICDKHVGGAISADVAEEYLFGHYDNFSIFNFRYALLQRSLSRIDIAFSIKNYNRISRVSRRPYFWILACLIPRYLVCFSVSGYRKIRDFYIN